MKSHATPSARYATTDVTMYPSRTHKSSADLSAHSLHRIRIKQHGSDSQEMLVIASVETAFSCRARRSVTRAPHPYHSRSSRTSRRRFKTAVNSRTFQITETVQVDSGAVRPHLTFMPIASAFNLALFIRIFVTILAPLYTLAAEHGHIYYMIDIFIYIFRIYLFRCRHL